MPAFSLPGINWKWFHSVKAGGGGSDAALDGLPTAALRKRRGIQRPDRTRDISIGSGDAALDIGAGWPSSESVKLDSST